MGKQWKNPKENHESKVTKIPKTKRRIYGINETLLNQNNRFNTYKITDNSSIQKSTFGNIKLNVL